MPIGRMQLPRELRSSGGIMSIGDQGGMKNYLGNQPMVTAPKFWRSGPESPPTELAYITDAEKDLIMRADLHGSLSQGPNEGPSGIMSLDSQGDYTRDRSPAGRQSSPGGPDRSSQAQSQHEQHMRNILTGQQNIGQTVQTGPKTRKYAVPEYVNVKQPDGTYKNKYIGSGYKSYGQPSFFGNLFSRGAPGYRGIKGMPAFFGKPKFETRGTPGGPNFGYYSDYEKFGETRDAFPSFGIMGILANLANKFRKPRDMSQYNQLGLYENRVTPTYYNDFDNELALGTKTTPLTQKLMTKTYEPSGSLPQKLIPLEEKQFMESFRTEKAPGVPYNKADFPYLGPKQIFSSPGVSADGVTLYDAYTGGVKPVEAQRMYRTPRTIGDQMYYSTSLPENNLRAELTDQQKRFIDKKKFALQEGLISPGSVYDTITNPDLGVYDTGIFGFGEQEPTTKDEYNDYLQSIGVTAQV
jgi:hypothetical protein